MTKTKLVATITIAIVLALILTTPAYAVTVTVKTDKTAYKPGETLTVSGTVSPVTAGQDVAIQVFGPVGELKSVGQATPTADGTYSASIMVFKPEDPSGTWSVKAAYMGVTAAASFTYTGVPPVVEIALTVVVDVGPIYFAGEKAEFYVLTYWFPWKPIDANLTATIYPPKTVLTAEKVATGLYKVTYSIPATAAAGTYALVVEASVKTAEYEGKAIALKSFQLSPTLSAQLVAISGDVATIKTLAGTINVTVSAIKPVVTKIEGDVATVKTDVGEIKGKVITVDGNVAKILTSEGIITADVKAIRTTVEGFPTAAVYAAVVLSLIAAIAAVYSVVVIQRKIAA